MTKRYIENMIDDKHYLLIIHWFIKSGFWINFD